MFRCNEVVTNTKNLVLTKSFVNEGRLPECTSKGIDLPGKCLGLVRGCGFMGDYMSDNGRWYPSKLWKNTCGADYVKDMIANRLMFGTCGHPNTPGDEHPIIVDYLTVWSSYIYPRNTYNVKSIKHIIIWIHNRTSIM